jgi:hypothetical protein
MYAIRIAIFEFYKTKLTFTKLKFREIKNTARDNQSSVHRTHTMKIGHTLEHFYRIGIILADSVELPSTDKHSDHHLDLP